MAGLLQNQRLFGEYIPWLQALREKGAEMFKTAGLPDAKTEAWKYTRLRNLKTDDYVMAPSNFLEKLRAEAQEACTCHHEGDCGCNHGHEHNHQCGCGHEHCHCKPSLPFEAYVINFVDGKYMPPFPDFPRGVEVMSLMEAVLTDDTRDYLGKLADIEKYPFAALNSAYLEEGVFIRVAKNVSLDKPVVLFNHTHGTEENKFYNLRNVIVMENDSSARFIEYYTCSGAPKSRYLANIVNEVFLGRRAKLQHYKVQDEAFKAAHIALTQVRQKGCSEYESFCLQTGADIGRNETRVILKEEGAETEVNAAYLMSGWATLDTTTDIEHLAPETRSEQLVKGVVDGEAKGVFQGKIHIAPNAVQTEGHQLHKALLLSDAAEIDVKPELEIFADDVKCSHGAASGELDEEQLFYMRSRGIGLDEAKQILVDAYLDDVVAKISNEPVRDWVKTLLSEKNEAIHNQR